MKICTLHTSYYFFESFPVNSKIVFDNLIVSDILADPGAKSDVNIVPYPDLVFKNNVRADPCIIPNICLFADSYTGQIRQRFPMVVPWPMVSRLSIFVCSPNSVYPLKIEREIFVFA